MGKKSSSQEATVRAVTCSKCEAKTMTNPGSKHRRCPGTKNAKPVPKDKKRDTANRGIWQ